jgi:sirohydrochlorin cobaltochelatase
MAGDVEEFLARFLYQGPCLIGQVRATPDYSMFHKEDAETAHLEIFTDPHDAIEIARYDDAGKYRPLKTAPNLRHGWRLQLDGLKEVALGLDFLYPAALGTALLLTQARLATVDLRETFARQTGMYAVVRKITDDQAESVVFNTCNHEDGCLRHILWSISSHRRTSLSRLAGEVQPSENEIPLLCAEACNLLVAAGRKRLKAVT